MKYFGEICVLVVHAVVGTYCPIYLNIARNQRCAQLLGASVYSLFHPVNGNVITI